MTQNEVKRHAKRLLPRLQKRLGLDHWNLGLHFSADPSGNFAEVNVYQAYLIAHITVYTPPFENRSALQLEETLIHELAHLLVADLSGLIKAYIMDQVDSDEAEKIKSLESMAEERAVVQIVRAIMGRRESL